MSKRKIPAENNVSSNKKPKPETGINDDGDIQDHRVIPETGEPGTTFATNSGDNTREKPQALATKPEHEPDILTLKISKNKLIGLLLLLAFIFYTLNPIPSTADFEKMEFAQDFAQRIKDKEFTIADAAALGLTSSDFEKLGFDFEKLGFGLEKVPHVRTTGCSSQAHSDCGPENTLQELVNAWYSPPHKTKDQWIDYSFEQRLAIARVRIKGGSSTEGVKTVQVRELPSLKVLDTFVTKSGDSYETHIVNVGNADKIRLHFVDNHGSNDYMTVQHVEFFSF